MKNAILFVIGIFLSNTLNAQESVVPVCVTPTTISDRRPELYRDSVKISLSVKAPKLEEYKQIHIIPGSTVNQVLYGYYEVVNKKVCCNEHDIWSINGIETTSDSFWVIKVNGNSQNYSSQSTLNEGDILELTYLSKEQYENHLALESWIEQER